MRIVVACGLLLASSLLTPAVASEEACESKPDALGVSRTLEIDTSAGPRFGTLQYAKTVDLEDNEVVLTFDDGPHPGTTARILKALKDECVKATFFPVGRSAKAYPQIVRDIAEQGHTLGGHSWSHPNVGRLSHRNAVKQIETGFRAVEDAAGKDIAPFFRFPGLNDSKAMKRYAEQRGLAIFSTDISSDDWRNIGASTILRRTMERTRQKGSGIIIFHDTKIGTAAALPSLLRALKAGGFKVVHIVPKNPYSATNQAADLQPRVTPASAKRGVN